MLSNQTKAVDWTRRICVMTCIAGLLSTSAFAQDPTIQPDRCQAPDRQQNQNDITTQASSQPARSDTQKLSDCNGVLKPPSTGDSDLVQPAPPVGDTPTIPPGALPQRQQ